MKFFFVGNYIIDLSAVYYIHFTQVPSKGPGVWEDSITFEFGESVPQVEIRGENATKAWAFLQSDNRLSWR